MTEHVWEEVEVDVPVNAPVQPPVLRKPAVAPSAAPAVVFTPKTGAPASSPMPEPKKASAGTSKK